MVNHLELKNKTMKIKIIKDNEVVVDGKEYARLLRFEHDFFAMQYAIYDGCKPMFTAVTDLDGSWTVAMGHEGFITNIKRFASDDPDYNLVCAEELVELLNKDQ